MTQGLRERKRRATMLRIQETALDLFDAQGFTSVSVEQIADTAEVSASSVYRYFGTKEGIILSDDFDFLSDEELRGAVDPKNLVATIRGIASRLERTTTTSTPESLARRRIRYFFNEPAVRRASYESLGTTAERIATVLTASGTLPTAQAHVAAAALVFGYFAALEQWHLHPDENPLSDTLMQALAALGKP